jgi:hypothetical protein
MRIGTPTSASSGISLEVTCKGHNKRVSLRGWHSDNVTIPPVHFSLDELAHALGLQVPERKKVKGPKTFPNAARERKSA